MKRSASDCQVSFQVLSYGYKPLVAGQISDSYIYRSNPSGSETSVEKIGCIPVNFSAYLNIGTSLIGLSTRRGLQGPEYQICFPNLGSMLIDWSGDIDAAWITALQKIEDAKAFNLDISESLLQQLDADPLHIFGIADVTTQRKIHSLSIADCILKCSSSVPNMADWYSYLKADKDVESRLAWIVESFRDCVLPAPWTASKSDGDVIIYRNRETTQSTFKHPFYEYFAELLEFCRHCSHEEQIKLRLNRLLWSYENEVDINPEGPEPLISPVSVKALSVIFALDIVQNPALVAHLKVFLKDISIQYRASDGVSSDQVSTFLNLIEARIDSNQIFPDLHVATIPFTDSGLVYCVSCSAAASCFCPKCADSFCADCSQQLHSKGMRFSHVMNQFIYCSVCKNLPSRLQCTYTFAFFCNSCYRRHANELPRFMDLKPIYIDYARIKAVARVHEGNRISEEACETVTSLLGSEWHPFHDIRGVKYYYNFSVDGCMRRPVFDSCDPYSGLSREGLHILSLSKSRRLLNSDADIQ
jgi:hypothetical protein